MTELRCILQKSLTLMPKYEHYNQKLLEMLQQNKKKLKIVNKRKLLNLAKILKISHERIAEPVKQKRNFPSSYQKMLHQKLHMTSQSPFYEIWMRSKLKRYWNPSLRMLLTFELGIGHV